MICKMEDKHIHLLQQLWELADINADADMYVFEY